MSFTTTLFTLIRSAGELSINGYETEEDGSHSTRTQMCLELTDGEYTSHVFADQEVAVDDCGAFTAVNCAGEVVQGVAMVTKPITETDLIKTPTTETAAAMEEARTTEPRFDNAEALFKFLSSPK